jgi:putative ABC transport system permease protein
MSYPTLNLFRKFILRDLRINYVRTLLTLFGIALGVAVMLAITLANNTALSKFKETVDLVSGRANLEVLPQTTPFLDEKYLYDLQWLWQMGGKFTPVIDENVIFGKNEDGTLVQMIGMDVLADPVFKSYEEDDSVGTLTDANVLKPGVALLGSKLAANEHLKQGDKFDLLTNEKTHSLRVARILPTKGLGGAFSGNLVVTDIRTAQEALGIPGKVSRIELVVPESYLLAVQDKLRHDFPKGISVERPSQRGNQVDKMTRSFQYNLLALTFIALMVSMFLIYNTMTISVIRRRPQIGTLRALGVSSGQILQMFTMEALAFGVVGTSLGILIGIGFAQGALNAVAQTFEHFYFRTPIETIMISPALIATAFAMGVGITVAAAIAPAMEAAGVAPAEAVRRASYELKSMRNAPRLAILGLILLACAGGLSVLPALDGVSVFGYASSLCTICGSAMLMPQTLQVVLPIISRIAEFFFRSEGRIAARSLQGTLGRTSVSIASLMIGIAMMVSLAIMIGSFRQTVMVWIDQTLKADLWVQTAARAGGSSQARMSADILDRIKALPGVLAVDGFVEHPIEYKGDITNVAGTDLNVSAKYGHLLFTEHENGRDICNSLGENDVIVTEAFAIRRQVHKGETLEIPSPSGTVQLKVRGIYYDYASDLGYIVMRRSSYAKIFADDKLSSFVVYVKPDVQPNDVRTDVLKAVGNKLRLRIRTTRELRTQALKIFDRTFAITYALHTIAIIVALLSVMNALFALTMESKREFGILRYIGASERQLRRIVLVEAGILGAIGNTTGLFLGFLLSLILIFVVNKQSFGWTVQFTMPIEFLLESGLLVFVTALIAGLIPARLAARTLAPSVVRDE